MCDDSCGKLADTLAHHQLAAGANHHVETAPTDVNRVDLFVGANGGSQRGVEFVAGKLGFGLVIIDVVITNRIDFRGVAGLAGAQNDAAFTNGQILTNGCY